MSLSTLAAATDDLLCDSLEVALDMADNDPEAAQIRAIWSVAEATSFAHVLQMLRTACDVGGSRDDGDASKRADVVASHLDAALQALRA